MARSQLPNVEAIGLIDPGDPWTWKLLLRGPADSPYAKRRLSLTLSFLAGHPHLPPSVWLDTPVFHTNVCPDSGLLCWSTGGDCSGSQFQVSALICTICALLVEPNVCSPLNAEAAQLYRSDRAAYIIRAASGGEKPYKQNRSGDGDDDDWGE